MTIIVNPIVDVIQVPVALPIMATKQVNLKLITGAIKVFIMVPYQTLGSFEMLVIFPFVKLIPIANQAKGA